MLLDDTHQLLGIVVLCALLKLVYRPFWAKKMGAPATSYFASRRPSIGL